MLVFSDSITAVVKHKLAQRKTCFQSSCPSLRWRLAMVLQVTQVNIPWFLAQFLRLVTGCFTVTAVLTGFDLSIYCMCVLHHPVSTFPCGDVAQVSVAFPWLTQPAQPREINCEFIVGLWKNLPCCYTLFLMGGIFKTEKVMFMMSQTHSGSTHNYLCVFMTYKCWFLTN